MIRVQHNNPNIPNPLEGKLIDFDIAKNGQLTLFVKAGPSPISYTVVPTSYQISGDTLFKHLGNLLIGHIDTETEAEARLWTLDYLRDFNPLGYGTTASKPKQVYNRWRVEISRSTSCD